MNGLGNVLCYLYFGFFETLKQRWEKLAEKPEVMCVLCCIDYCMQSDCTPLKQRDYHSIKKIEV